MNSVLFGDKHSYQYYKMILSGMTIGYPLAKTKYVDRPRGDGTYDVTEAFGGVKYNERTLSFQFISVGKWDRVKEAVINEIHGKRMKITLSNDDSYYYMGRCAIDDRKTDMNLHTISISALCEPYKYKWQVTEHMEKLSGTKEVILMNDHRAVIPTIECDSEMKLQMNGRNYNLQKGKQKVLDVKLVQGYNRMKVSGDGTIVFSYQEGAL